MDNIDGTRHQIARSRGIDVVLVESVHVDNDGYTITGTDQFGRRFNDLRMSIHESPVIIPENGEMVMVERNNNVPYAIRGKALTTDEIASLGLLPGDFAIVGHKRVFIFAEEFVVRNRKLLDEFTDGGGQNLLENSGFQRLNTPTILAEKFTLAQGLFNTVAWDPSGLAGQDGSFIFTINRPDDPVSITSNVSHAIIEGTFTLSTFLKSTNWSNDTADAETELFINTSKENRETLVRTLVAHLPIPINRDTAEGSGQAYVDGIDWFRPYGYVEVPPQAILDAERYVATFGFTAYGHYKRQLNPLIPDPKLWSFPAAKVSSGISDLTIQPGVNFCNIESWGVPSLADFKVIQQAGESATLLMAFADDSNYEGLEISPGVVHYVRVLADKRSVLAALNTSVVGGTTAYYRLHTVGGTTTLSVGSARGTVDKGTTAFANAYIGGRIGIKTTSHSIVVSAIDIFQPYTQQIDNVQLERGVSLSGWEGSVNEQTNVDDLLNMINDIPTDGSTIIADRIGAGTIAGRRIYVVNKPVTGAPLAGRAGVIQSSNFDAINPASYPARDGSKLSDIVGPAIAGGANQGWLILGNGQAWFHDVFISGNLSVGGKIDSSGGSSLITDGNLNGDNLVYSKNVYDQDPNSYARAIVNTAFRFITGGPTTHIGMVTRNSYAFLQMTFTMRNTDITANSNANSDYVNAQIFYGTAGNTADGQGTGAGLAQKQWLPGDGNWRTDNVNGDPLEEQYVLFARILLLPGIDYYVFPKFKSIHLANQSYIFDQYQCMGYVQAV